MGGVEARDEAWCKEGNQGSILGPHWRPGEHNGTFRGSNPAFVTAAAALQAYWSDDRLRETTEEKGEHVASYLSDLCRRQTALQQRLRTHTIELLFAAFLLAVAVWLFVK